MGEAQGDRVLAQRVRDHLGRHHRIVGAAEVTGGRVTVAAVGARVDADFEIGSISKAVTGLLYVDALDRGEVRSTSTLRDFLDLGDSPAGGVALASLSTHSSGLPRLPAEAHALRRTWDLWRHGTNPYGEDLTALLGQARHVTVGKPRYRYSNLGFELLGHAVAGAAGMTYPRLVEDRLVSPLGLTSTYVPSTLQELRPGAVAGTNRSGRETQPWTGAGLGPAGGIRASVRDLAALTAAILDGSAPGSGALDPVRNLSGPAARIGAGWMTLTVKGRDITWHNGGTGGFRSWLGVDRKEGTGVVILSATTRSVDRAGFALMERL